MSVQVAFEEVEEDFSRITSEVLGEVSEELHQVDTMDKQLTAFEKLTAHAVSRFSTERLHRLLQKLGDVPFPQTPKRVGAGSFSGAKIDSILKIREHLARLKRKEKATAADTQTLTALETFLRDVQYMRQVKKYFDEKIYCVLYKYFYDASDVVDEDERVESEIADDSSSPGVFLTEPEYPPTAGSSYGLAVDHLNGKQRLQFSVEELFNINCRWEKLLSDSVISAELFEADSEQDVRHLEPLETAGPMLRLVPDVFVKCSKSAELAKLWWNEASAVYELKPGQKVDNSKYEVNVRDLNQQLDGKISELRKMEHRLNINKQDLEFLESREARVKKLSSNCDKLENLIDQTGEQYKLTIERRKKLMEQLQNTVQGTLKYEEISEELKEIENKVLDQYKELKFVEYNLGISQGDYSVELEVRPSFVHFSEGARLKVEATKHEMEHIRTLRNKVEKKLVLMKTNHERMTEILMRVLGPEAAAGNSSAKSGSHKTYTFPPSKVMVALKPNDAASSSRVDDDSGDADDDDEDEDDDDDGGILKTARVDPRRPPRIVNHSQPLGSRT